jgi:hypothetical protein
MKKCSKCELDLPYDKFHKQKVSKDGYRSICKECRKISDKIYIINNKEKVKESIKNWRIENKEKIKEERRNYYLNNKSKIQSYNKEYNYDKNYHKEYVKNKRIEDPLFRISGNIRNLIYQYIKNNGYKKKSKTVNILGCEFNDFKLYIESKFESWMSWDNYGLYNGELNYGWDIDHIIPISSAKSEEIIIKLNHYTNLQPLCSTVNRNIKFNKL